MNPVMKAIAKIHTVLYQLSSGRIGTSMGGNKILLLHHIGAKSGKQYATPLAYVDDNADGRNAYAIIASAAGQDKHPGWYHNLKKNPTTTIDIGGKKISVVAEIAPREKRDKLWGEISVEFPQFEGYQQKTERVIPIILLHPQAA